jgi:histidine triad (HIT) family protein
MENDCLFCKIAAGEGDATIVFQDDRIVAFEDINPQAPHHVLLVPREHMDSLNDVAKGDEGLIGHLFRIAAQIADGRGLADSGSRAVVNTGGDAGQSVEHLHVHLLGGRSLAWPPG